MATATISAKPRTDTGKGVARKLRAQHSLPGILYGHHREPQPLVLDGRDFDRLIEHYAAETTVVELTLDGQSVRTLIREIQRHPFKRQVLHVDFQALVAGEKVMVDVPIVLVGIPEGVRVTGGTLDQVMRELTIEVDPSNIPNHFDVDVSALNVGDSLHVSDIPLPEGVEVQDEPDTTICVVVPPRVVEEVAAPAAEVEDTGAEPELIRKKDEESEENE
ncbi:MAG TPA: 50S ribosomal protein L25 [Gemmatimonadaceae bacterium]|nr:50S ribosomal protein L25 [Gemmatimonadaceae bacterium]